MTLSFCKLFHAIIQQGTFLKAAEILHMSPSAVSHAVSDAEKQIGFQLFNRTKNGITMTENASSLYASILRLLNSEEALQQVIDKMKGLEQGLINIGVFNSVCTNWMPDIFRQFGMRYPGVEICIYEGSYEDVIYWIKTGIADFGFLSISCTTELPVEALYRDPLVCIVPKDFKTKTQGYITVEEMKNQRFVIQRKGSDADVQMLIKKYNLQFHSDCHVLDDTSIMAMVACGRGISVMPTLTAKGLGGDLQVLHIQPDECRIIGLSALNKKMLSPAAKALYQYICNYAKVLNLGADPKLS